MALVRNPFPLLLPGQPAVRQPLRNVIRPRDAVLGLPISVADKRTILTEMQSASGEGESEEGDDESSNTSVEYASPTLLSLLTTSNFRAPPIPTTATRPATTASGTIMPSSWPLTTCLTPMPLLRQS